jgi:hypothetical protein
LDDSARLELRRNSGPGSSEVHPVIFVVDEGAAEKRPKSASNAGSNELPLWKAEQYGALCCVVLVLFSKIFNFSLITNFMTTMVKPSRKPGLTTATLLWVALTYLPFQHHTHSLPWNIVLFM